MWTAKPKLFIVCPFGGTGRPASTLGHALSTSPSLLPAPTKHCCPIAHSLLGIPKQTKALIDGVPVSIFLDGLHCSPSSAVIAFIF